MTKKNTEYKLKDISVIIPTYNRSGDLEKTLKSFGTNISKINEILVVDQSEDSKTKQLIKELKISNLKYIYSRPASITLARNLGVKKASKDSSIILFLDDDVTLGKNYFNEIVKIFNERPEAKAAAGYVPSPELAKISSIEIFLRKMFFISYPEINKARMSAPYANTYPKSLTRTINSQWLPGVNMAYKKEIFKEQEFDKNLLGYTVAEDIDFSYRIYKKYPNSLFITPEAKLIHRASNVERYLTEKISFINQIDHFYFYQKNMNEGFRNKFVFVWSLLGISLLRTMKALFSGKKTDYLKLKFFFKSLIYSIRNMKSIRKGRLRDF